MNINATLFVEMVIFIAFVMLTMRYVWPPLKKVIEERKLLIEQGIKNSEEAKVTLEEAKENAEHIVHVAKERAYQIVSEAKKEASDIILKGKEQITLQKQKSEADMQAEAQHIISQARKNLHKEITQVAVSLCEKVLMETKLDDRIQKHILSSYTQQETD